MRHSITDTAAPEALASDADLTPRIRSCPPAAADAAFDELYRRHHASVLSYARSCTRDPHTAEDLASEAFTRALQAVQRGAGPESAWRPYLLTVVRRTAAAWAATARRTELSTDFETWLSQMPAGESGEDRALRREDADLALRAFRSLPDRWQTALWHSVVEGESPERIAPLLGLSASGAASLTSRAREGLREAYLAEHASDTAASEECRYFTGLLAASVRSSGRRHRTHRGLNRHLANCPRCRRASTELRDLNKLLSIVLPAGVLLWTGASYGTKATAATGSGIGVTASSTGLGATAKVGGIAVSLLALALGGYAFFPDSDELSAPSPSPSVTRSATTVPSSSPARKEERQEREGKKEVEKNKEKKSKLRSSSSSSPTPPEGSTRPETPPSWQPAADDRTQLPIASTGRCMDISKEEGAEPREAACDGSRSQQWELLVDRAGQEARIRNYETGMCLTHTGTSTDGAPVRQQHSCDSSAATARWTYFRDKAGRIAFAQKGNSMYFLGLDEWNKTAPGQAHSPAIGTTMNYYDSSSLRFRYEGGAFGG
ncbi:sigma-70 family RNA polymerase sigma factor [Streptomyces rimosus]|uniref:sigma-70 family RNA polymerase sigma factor n=1 Tax=Streptomyces rimosus TaxID=1927 RepID=UPI00067CBF49|nr:sigma-70 family RNA polymerase sigma factor [Streptomyces rimosus]